VVGGVDFDMVKVPPGRFVDGEATGRRELLVSRPFEIGVTLVTQALWRAVMRGDPSRFLGQDFPVEMITWDDVQAFLARLSGLGLRGFRLPAEVEWAWVARCGVPTGWAGADRTQSVAVMGGSQTAPVAGLSGSAVGAFDASGNVREWQQDGSVETPPGGVDVQSSASGSRHITRGGGWSLGSSYTRVAHRGLSIPFNRFHNLGFRLARSLP